MTCEGEPILVLPRIYTNMYVDIRYTFYYREHESLPQQSRVLLIWFSVFVTGRASAQVVRETKTEPRYRHGQVLKVTVKETTQDYSLLQCYPLVGLYHKLVFSRNMNKAYIVCETNTPPRYPDTSRARRRKSPQKKSLWIAR